MRIAQISSKQQLTLSKKELEALGIQKSSKVVVQTKKEVLFIKPLETSIVDQTGGSLTSYIDRSKLKVNFSKIMIQTKKKTAARLLENLCRTNTHDSRLGMNNDLHQGSRQGGVRQKRPRRYRRGDS